MKRIFSILSLLVAAAPALAVELPVTTNAAFCRFNSSYFTLNCAGCYEDSGRYLYWPKLNIHCNENSRSGGSIEDANETRLERRGLAEWATGQQWWGEIWADNNGGYDSNGVIANVTNTFNSPGLFFNGTAYTNEGGWAQAHADQIHWIGGGSIPVTGGVANGTTEEKINNAMTNAATVFAYLGFDMFHVLNFIAGWSNDIVSDANLRLSIDGEHPGAPGALGMAIVANEATMDTNVNMAIIDWNATAVTLTNHCVVSGVSLSGNTLTFTWLADRHSMAWDCPDGTITNDAGNAFVMQPAFSNAFYEVLRFTNAPPDATFTMLEDGSNILTVTSTDLTNGINLFSVTRGALWAQRKEVLGRIRDRRYCDRVTLVNGSASDHQGEVGWDNDSQFYWDEGHRGDTLISDLAPEVSNLNSNDTRIWTAAMPTNHAFAFSQNPSPPPVFAPFHR